MAFILTADQKVAVSIAPVDAYGNAAALDGVPVWASSNEAVATVANVAVDGLSAEVVATGPAGTAQVSVQADADLGEGVVTLTGLLDVEVIAGQASALSINTGTAQAKA